MGLINISDLEDGTSADANDINSRVATILGLVNGNIDSANIKAGGINNANLASESITNGKLSTAAGELGGAWQSYTPTFTNLSGGTLNYGKYIQLGKTVFFKVKYTLSGANVSGQIGVSLPVAANQVSPAATTDVFNISVEMKDNSGSNNAYPGWASMGDYSTVNIYAITTDTTGSGTYTSYTSTSPTKPIQWAANDYIIVSGYYEAA